MGTLSTAKTFHVIAGTDFSDLGDRAIVAALRQARQQPKSELHVISVVNGGEDATLGESEEFLRNRVQDLLAPEAESSMANVERINIYLTTGNPAKRIVHLAEHLDADLIVVGTQGRTGLKGLVLGSVAAEVVRHAPCGVLVIRPRDFVAGHKVPEVEPELPRGQHSLRPFHHAPTHHYVDRGAAASSRMFTTW